MGIGARCVLVSSDGRGVTLSASSRCGEALGVELDLRHMCDSGPRDRPLSWPDSSLEVAVRSSVGSGGGAPNHERRRAVAPSAVAVVPDTVVARGMATPSSSGGVEDELAVGSFGAECVRRWSFQHRC